MDPHGTGAFRIRRRADNLVGPSFASSTVGMRQDCGSARRVPSVDRALQLLALELASGATQLHCMTFFRHPTTRRRRQYISKGLLGQGGQDRSGGRARTPSPTGTSAAARTSSPTVMPHMTPTTSKRSHSQSESLIERGSRFSAPARSSGDFWDDVRHRPLPAPRGHAVGGGVFAPVGAVPARQRPSSMSAARPRPDEGPTPFRGAGHGTLLDVRTIPTLSATGVTAACAVRVEGGIEIEVVANFGRGQGMHGLARRAPREQVDAGCLEISRTRYEQGEVKL